MKRYISHIVFALLGCMVLSACVDNDYMELDKGHNELALSTSNTEVVLNEQAHGDDALELSWTTGTNYGTGNKISYTLELAKAGSNFTAPYVALENVVQEYTWKKSVEELNNILREHFGAEATENISLEARLTAKVTDREETQVATTSFSVTAYKPFTSTFLFHGYNSMPYTYNTIPYEKVNNLLRLFFSYRSFSGIHRKITKRCLDSINAIL